MTAPQSERNHSRSDSNSNAAPGGAREAPAIRYDDELPPSLKVVPTVFPTSPPLDQCLDRFWETGRDFGKIVMAIEPPPQPLAILEKLGPSPFERGGFPLVGFLATTYEKVGQYALDRK